MPRAYGIIITALRVLVWAFFRRVEVSGLENLPTQGGGLIVSWHPNGLVDPGLVLTSCGRRVVFGARHGLFHWPLLGHLMRAIGTVPIYRAADDAKGDVAARREANKKSLAALAQAVAGGEVASLFPEGVSHDAPHPMALKSGAARLYYQARMLMGDGAPPFIVPVGLHYDRKRRFRSHALVVFHPPIVLPEALDVTPPADEPAETAADRARALTACIEAELVEAVHATDDWQLHHLMHRARKIIRAEGIARAGTPSERPSIEERTLGFARIRAGYLARQQTHADEVAKLRARIESYDADIRALSLDDHELDKPPPLTSGWLPVLVALQALTVFLLMPPILLVGYVVNLPPALALKGLARLASKKKKDEATVKILAGAVLMPLTWAAVGVGAALSHAKLHAAFPSVPDAPVLSGVIAALVSLVGGAMALRYLRVARETARAVRVRLTRRRRWFAVARLKRERGLLYDALKGIAEGLVLPGDPVPASASA